MRTSGGGAVVHAGSVAGGYGSIGLEGGLEFGKGFDRSVFADGFVASGVRRGRALCVGNGDGFGGEAALIPGGGGAAVAFDGVAILHFAGDVVLFGDEFAGNAHVDVGMGAPEAVFDGGVDEFGVAEAQAFAGGQQVRARCSWTPCRRRRRSRRLPVMMAWAARATALRPLPQTMLMVSALTVSARPPRRAAWRAGFWPRPAGRTQPMMHSSTGSQAGKAARRTASRTTIAPRSTAEMSLSAPRNLPTGVRTALTMTTSSHGRPLRLSAVSLAGLTRS